ncbi:hypothetical protein PQ455_14230 [Sphingomonas naphthae]|uniref:Myb-like domain-containing protein n=1 Tax=Sphingomonas naphthae TaxID=1813468 RepID=A0ABY7TI05_9SPHN|nr:hypothetical protein [Sphingomonas naphthae]WCT72784.1 hypothetical protein PQ455_14230 [Sphingomonas naphthae]
MFGHRKRHNQPWTDEADAELARHIASGALLPEIARAMERSQEAVRSRANVLKLPVRSTNRGVKDA